MRPSISNILQEDLDAIVSADLPFHLLDQKTVLISGANGFVPAYLVRALLHLRRTNGISVKVVGLVRNRERAEKALSDILEDDNFSLNAGDVCQDFSYEGSIDIVIHAASQASPKYFGADPVGTLKANVLGTYALLELARRKAAESFLFFSSGEVYGATQGDAIRETDSGAVDSMQVRSCYAESKRMGETMCVAWHHQHRVPTKIVRLFHTYGPGMDLCDGRVFADFVADITAHRDIIMKSDGNSVRAFCYLVDSITGILTVLLMGESGQAYNVGNEACRCRIRELAALLCRLYPRSCLKSLRGTARPVGYLESPFDVVVPDTEKLRSLGWRPRYTLEEGFRRTVESFQ